MKKIKDMIDSYSAGRIAMENISILTQIILGVWILTPFTLFGFPVGSLVYAAFAVTMLAFVLRSQLCTHCSYYGKSCHCGWGKLAARLYPKGSGKQKLGGRLADLTWMLLMLVPLAGGIYTLITGFSVKRLLVLGFFLLAVMANMILHVRDCSECRMREDCPGSAWKPGKENGI